MQETGITSNRSAMKPIVSGLINSLRWRQLVSSLVIIATGIAGIGAVYLGYQHDAMLAAQGLKMDKDAYKIIGSIEPYPDYNLFVLGEHVNEASFLDNLKVRGFTASFTDSGDSYYAYIQEIGGNKGIFWSSRHPNEVPLANKSPYSTWKKRDFLTFSLPHPLVKDNSYLGILSPAKAAGRNPGSNLQDSNNKFIIYARRFAYANDRAFRIILAKSTVGLEKQKADLASGFGVLVLVTTLLVLLAQLVGSYIVLAPIRRIEAEIKLIEAGEKDRIEHEYPSELNPVKSAINTLINAEKGQKKRYRDALDNLAHALKTPLAALQSASARSVGEEKINQTYVDEQIQRMNDIVAYQLRRAVVSDHNTIVKLENLRPVVFRLRESLLKVYFDKQFSLEIDIDEYAKCRVEYDDLMEVFGNLLNNACRFCEAKVSVTATQDVDFLIVDIDDDGMGFPDNNPSQLLKRGMRADSKTEGQGIGLAVSTEIIENAGGKISLMMSPYIGARVRLHLPV